MSLLSKITGEDKRRNKRMSSQAADPYNPANHFGAAMMESGKNAGADRNSLLSLLSGGQDALNTYASAAVSAAMPGLQSTLQGARESAQRRGISTGDLGTSYEGDIMSAFQKNLTDSIASQSLGLYNSQVGATESLYGMEQGNYLDLISGALDRKQAGRNAKKQYTSNLLGGLMQMYGTAAGAAAGAA